MPHTSAKLRIYYSYLNHASIPIWLDQQLNNLNTLYQQNAQVSFNVWVFFGRLEGFFK